MFYCSVMRAGLNSQWGIKPQTFRLRALMLYRWATETLWWVRRPACCEDQQCCRVWARLHHCANPALQLKLSLKKTVKGTICPLQNLGKKLERKHTQRVLSRYRNCKLKQNVESIFSCTFKVHSKVTFQSHFTEHVRLMLNQAWWTHVAIFTTLFTNMRTQKFKSRLHNYVFCCPQS